MPDTPNIDFTVQPAGMVSVPIDATLSIAGQAADAKAVGDALATKADKSEIAASIKVNGQGADLQGEIIVTAEHVPMDDNETSTVAEEIDDLKSRTAEDIPVSPESGAQSIAEALEAASAGAVVRGNVAALTGSVADGSRAVEAMAFGGTQLPMKDAGAVRSVNGERPDTAGNVEITHVETAHNLTADDAQSNVARFVLRTTGGDTPVADGAAWLAEIRGAFEHTGVVEEQLTMTVTPAARAEGVASITATIDAAAFKAAVDESSTITLAYTGGDWDTAPDTMGITVSGVPVNGDEIAVVYVKADRGLITPATPTALRATGWNLYNHTAGYARVVKYSDTYGFRVEGSYTGLTYSETENGERTTITPVNGAFDVPGDGYVWVAGGDGTSTTVYMTWSDWTGGHGGSFEAYAESVIDLSGLVEDYFPNGMMAVGGVADAISLDMQTLTVAIERLTYSEETIAQLDAAGRPWEADSDYIYTAKEKPVTVTGIGVASRYTVSDHGMEIVSGTEVAPQILALYGQNLRDKLRMNVLTIGQQSLSSAQKAQVQTNLGVPSTSEMNTAIAQSTAFVPSNGNAGFHNSIYRGKYLGNTFTAEQDAAIRAGTFDGMFVGDYWTINGVDWVIVGFDIRFNIGDAALTTHHIGIMPRANLYSRQWHTSNDTSMGYVGSAIRANIKASGGAQEKFIAAFGSANVLSFRELYPTTYSGGNATGWAWVDARTELLSEVDVYGCPVWSVGGKGYEVGEDKSQLPIFWLRPDFANIRTTWWLRSVYSAANAAGVGYEGIAANYAASNTTGVRPLSLIA